MVRYSKRCITSIAALFALVLLASASSAQTSLATLRGKVTDEQGGVLPGATVTARHVETNTTRTGVTEALGQYVLPNLPAGTYELTVDLTGFTSGKRQNVALRV